MELLGQAVRLIRVSRALIRNGGLLQRPRRDRRIVVKQRDTHECLSGIVEMAPLELHVTREQTRFSVDPTFGLQGHDLFRDLLRIIRFVRRDFHRAECEQRFRLARGIGRHLQIFGQTRSPIRQISAAWPQHLRDRTRSRALRLRDCRSFPVHSGTSRRRIIFFVVILDPEPLQDFRRNDLVRDRRHETINFLRQGCAIVQREIAGEDQNGRRFVYFS